jgi:hypothetical protein
MLRYVCGPVGLPKRVFVTLLRVLLAELFFDPLDLSVGRVSWAGGSAVIGLLVS